MEPIWGRQDPGVPNVRPMNFPDSKIHGANMGHTWVLPAPGGPHVGPMNLVIWVCYLGGVPNHWCTPYISVYHTHRRQQRYFGYRTMVFCFADRRSWWTSQIVFFTHNKVASLCVWVGVKARFINLVILQWYYHSGVFQDFRSLDFARHTNMIIS